MTCEAEAGPKPGRAGPGGRANRARLKFGRPGNLTAEFIAV